MISPTTPARAPRVSGATSATRVHATNAAESTNDSASTSSANGAVMRLTSTPPTLGPTTWAAADVDWSLVLPSTMRSAVTSEGSNDMFATSKSTVRAPVSRSTV